MVRLQKLIIGVVGMMILGAILVGTVFAYELFLLYRECAPFTDFGPFAAPEGFLPEGHCDLLFHVDWFPQP